MDNDEQKDKTQLRYCYVVISLRCDADTTHFYLPTFCLPDSFNFHFIFSQTSLITNSETSHKQWTRMLLVVSTTFCVLHWYDHSWLTGCKTSSIYLIPSCLSIPTGHLKSTFYHAAYGYDVWKMFVFLCVWIQLALRAALSFKLFTHAHTHARTTQMQRDDSETKGEHCTQHQQGGGGGVNNTNKQKCDYAHV